MLERVRDEIDGAPLRIPTAEWTVGTMHNRLLMH